MAGSRLAKILGTAGPHYPVSDKYERDYLPGPSWWSSQQEHVTSWLNELDGPGAYDRQTRGLGAKHFYNHFQCAPGLLWVAEALGEDLAVVQRAADSAGGVGRGGTQCAMIRRGIPWSRIEALAAHRESQSASNSRWSKLRARLSRTGTQGAGSEAWTAWVAVAVLGSPSNVQLGARGEALDGSEVHPFAHPNRGRTARWPRDARAAPPS